LRHTYTRIIHISIIYPSRVRHSHHSLLFLLSLPRIGCSPRKRKNIRAALTDTHKHTLSSIFSSSFCLHTHMNRIPTIETWWAKDPINESPARVAPFQHIEMVYVWGPLRAQRKRPYVSLLDFPPRSLLPPTPTF